MSWSRTLLCVSAGLIVSGVMLVGCAEKKAAPAPSQRQIQADSDRMFDKMKEEERDHGTSVEKPRSDDGGY